MKPLFVLIIVFLVSLAVSSFTSGVDPNLSGKIALSVMLLFTSLGHFKFTQGMMMMMPQRLPAKKEFVVATGIIEILAAIGIHVPAISRLTGILLIIFFILILPSNISAAMRHVNYEKADYSGQGVQYLWFRVPFQVLLIGWTYLFVIR